MIGAVARKTKRPGKGGRPAGDVGPRHNDRVVFKLCTVRFVGTTSVALEWDDRIEWFAWSHLVTTSSAFIEAGWENQPLRVGILAWKAKQVGWA